VKAFSRCGEDGICDRRRGETHGGFAKALWISMAFNEPGFQLRNLSETKNAVIVKVLLLDCAVLNRDGFFEDRTKAEDCSTF